MTAGNKAPFGFQQAKKANRLRAQGMCEEAIGGIKTMAPVVGNYDLSRYREIDPSIELLDCSIAFSCQRSNDEAIEANKTTIEQTNGQSGLSLELLDRSLAFSWTSLSDRTT